MLLSPIFEECTWTQNANIIDKDTDLLVILTIKMAFVKIENLDNNDDGVTDGSQTVEDGTGDDEVSLN